MTQSHYCVRHVDVVGAVCVCVYELKGIKTATMQAVRWLAYTVYLFTNRKQTVWVAASCFFVNIKFDRRTADFYLFPYNLPVFRFGPLP